MKELRRWVFGLVALLTVGCGVDPGDSSGGGGSAGSGDPGGGGTGGSGGTGLQCPDDPALGPVAPECGIWVSAGKGDDTAEGTQDAPVATLTRAVELAAKERGRVYACAETWAETLVMPGHVSLHGGFDCENGWAYVGGEEKQSILASPGPIALTWADGDDSETTPFLTDFHIESADAVEPGGSSIVVFIQAKDLFATIQRCLLIGGNGAHGEDGAPGDMDGQPAPSGVSGMQGQSACSGPGSKGGAPPQNICESGISKGGIGGDSGPLTATNGGAGEPAADPPAGEGGLGEQSGPQCTPGQSGASGTAGSYGLGGKEGLSRLTVDGFIGVAGEDGKPGAPGQGGGGGGATFGSVAVCGAANPGGAAGGSGGAGGCGGKPGRGGLPGGASFVVATLSETVIWESILIAGDGGNGGNGGPPQDGGSGGLPGLGGAGAGTIKPGCAGGNGGSGGEGGWGGGGAGGLSLIITTPFGGAIGYSSKDWVEGNGGKGGAGAPLQSESRGEDGTRATYKFLNP